MPNVVRFLLEHLGTGGYRNLINGSLFFSGISILGLSYLQGVKKILLNLIPLVCLAFLSFQLKIPAERIHFIEYGLLGIFVIRPYATGTWKFLLPAFLLVCLIGAGDELIQWFLPNRVGEWKDVGLNVIGGFFGLWIGKVTFK